MRNGHNHTYIRPTQLTKPGRQLLSLFAFLCLHFLLSSCQPISLPFEPIAGESNQPPTTTATASPTVSPTSTTTATVRADVLPLPTSTPTGAAASLVETSTITVEAVLLLLPTATFTAEKLPAPIEEQPATATEVLPVSTDTAVSTPLVRAAKTINVRNGPGTDYAAVNALEANTQADVIGKNVDASWWQITLLDGTTGWVFASLVEFVGDLSALPVVDVALPPPTATPLPTSIALPVPTAAAETAVVQIVSVVEPSAPRADSPNSDVPSFRVVDKRLWDVYENGGSLNGESVHCGEKRQLVVTVIDGNGVRLNGIPVQVIYGAKEIFVTGSQGKGDGNAEFVLGSGQDVTVIRDADGRPAVSELATGLVTDPQYISYETLIAGRFCTDDTSCKSFINTRGCYGHYSWTVTFQRNY